MKLKTRFLLLLSAIFFGLMLIMWLMSRQVIDQVSQQWGVQFAERQVMFDKYRTLSPLMREIALARQMAAEPAVIDMALHEDNAAIRKRGITAMEKYRFNFRDHSYFAAFARSGHYYFNDAQNQYGGRQLRYTLSPKSSKDKWFYATLNDDSEYQVNLDPDVHLGVTKAWINVVIRHGQEKIGVVGSGLDLSELLRETVDLEQPGVHNLFIDKSLAIQLNSDPALIDYMTIAKEEGERIKVDLLLKNPSDIRKLREAMKALEFAPGNISTLLVDYQGSTHLLGVAYLPEIGWYDLTLLDIHSVNLLKDLATVPLLFGAAMLLALLTVAWALQRWILKPIAALHASAEEIRSGNFEVDARLDGSGEIPELSRAFDRMARFVIQNNRELEQKVELRTHELHHLTETDPLTGLLNRRGMTDRFEKEIARQARSGQGLCLILLDLDHFKQINDTYGHSAGDLALCEVSRVIQSTMRSYDHAARWGGEEFLILLPDCGDIDMMTIAERLRSGVSALQIQAGESSFGFTVSIGVHHPRSPQTLDTMLQKVDAALYAAKDGGRNCIRIAN
jgi:diguanylate cyclase (GGDEF)-like protein